MKTIGLACQTFVGKFLDSVFAPQLSRPQPAQSRFAASPTAAVSLTPKKNAIGSPLADALQLLPQPLYVNQTLTRALLHMDMLVQVAVVNQSVELRPGLISRASCSLANRH